MERAVDHMTVKIAITAAVLGAAIVGLVHASTPADVPYRLVDQLTAAERSRWTDHEIRVNGQILRDSIVDVSRDPRTTRFVLYKGASQLRVIATDPSSWVVGPDHELVAQGRLVRADDGDYVLMATELNARCPSRYDRRAGACPPPASEPRFQ
jgi:hypothetical protein